MADTPWGDFDDATALEAADVGLMMRGAGGKNFPFSMLAHKRSDGNFYCAGPLRLVSTINADNLRLDNTGQQYTSCDFYNNAISKAASYWDNVGSQFVFRTMVAGTIGFDINLTRKASLTSTGLSVDGRVTSTLAGSVANPNFYAVNGGVEYVAGVDPINVIGFVGTYSSTDLVLVRGTSEKARLTSSGMTVTGDSKATGALISTGGIVTSSGTVAFLDCAGAAKARIGGLTFPSTRLPVELYCATSVTPSNDNNALLGTASFRWSGGHIAVAWTVSSDARGKRVRGDGGPTPEEIVWAKAIRPKAYQLLDSIAEKGEALARIHWGVLAQEVHQAGLDAGVAEPFRHGFLGFDALTVSEARPVSVERQKVEIVPETVSEVEIRDGVPVLVMKTIEREQPVFTNELLFDEAGEPVMVESAEDEDEEEQEQEQAAKTNMKAAPAASAAAAKMKMVQATYPVPVMETVEEMLEVEVPMLDENDEPVLRWNIRYEELIMFLFACGALSLEAAT